MKTIRHFLFSALLCYSSSIFCQQCSNDSLLLLTSLEAEYSDPGFISSNHLPCIQSGVYSELIIPFNTYNQGARLLMLPDSSSIPVSTIYSIKIESLPNLPSGLCWVTRPGNQTITGTQTGEIIIKGTTSLATGVYPLSVKLSLDIRGNGAFTYTGLDVANYQSLLGGVTLRVMDSTLNCPTISQ